MTQSKNIFKDSFRFSESVDKAEGESPDQKKEVVTKEEKSDDDYEYVSSETIHDAVVWFYKVLLRLSFLFKDVTSL